MIAPVRHFSVSQLGMYCRCAEQYRRRYIDGDKVPPGIALLVGGGVHGGIDAAMKGKKETGSDMPPDDLRDAAVASFDMRLSREEVSLTKEEREVGRAVVIGSSRDRVAALSHYWGVVAQPGYSPLGSEVEFTLPMEREVGLPLVGVVDLIEAGRVTDFKTSGSRAVSQREADVSLQLTAYSLHVHRVQGTAPEVRLDQLLDRSGKTERRVLSAKRTRADYERLVLRLRATIAAVRAGNFPPCSPENWGCSERWCGFAATCPYFIPELEAGKAG